MGLRRLRSSTPATANIHGEGFQLMRIFVTMPQPQGIVNARVAAGPRQPLRTAMLCPLSVFHFPPESKHSSLHLSGRAKSGVAAFAANTSGGGDKNA